MFNGRRVFLLVLKAMFLLSNVMRKNSLVTEKLLFSHSHVSPIKVLFFFCFVSFIYDDSNTFHFIKKCWKYSIRRKVCPKVYIQWYASLRVSAFLVYFCQILIILHSYIEVRAKIRKRWYKIYLYYASMSFRLFIFWMKYMKFVRKLFVFFSLGFYSQIFQRLLTWGRRNENPNKWGTKTK